MAGWQPEQPARECRHSGGSPMADRRQGSGGRGYREQDAAALPRSGRNSLRLTRWQDERRQRQAVMAAARVREQRRQRAARAALPVAALPGIGAAAAAALRDYISTGGRSLRHMSREQAAGLLLAQRAARQWAAQHRAAPEQGSRPTILPAPSSVRAGEHRAAERWQSTPMPEQPCYRLTLAPGYLTRSGSTVAALAGLAAAGIGAAWQPWQPAARSTGRKRPTVGKSAAAQRQSRLLAAAGTVRMAEQD
jgi:hypothetical protein